MVCLEWHRQMSSHLTHILGALGNGKNLQWVLPVLSTRSKLSILIEDQKRMRRRKKQFPSMVKSPPSLGTWTIGDGLMKVVFLTTPLRQVETLSSIRTHESHARRTNFRATFQPKPLIFVGLEQVIKPWRCFTSEGPCLPLVWACFLGS